MNGPASPARRRAPSPASPAECAPPCGKRSKTLRNSASWGLHAAVKPFTGPSPTGLNGQFYSVRVEPYLWAP
eukprot:1030152-Pyramimonas_sp.AAC.1